MIAYLDCASGISGDKFLAATIDAGASLDGARDALSALGLDIDLQAGEVVRGGVRALSTRITAPSEQPRRTWREIDTMLERAQLSAQVSEHSRAVFARLAEVEGSVHGIPAADVHFHEVGAADAIGEIVGVVWAVHSLGIAELVVSPVALGSGTVESEHGTLPVPAPATAQLLRDAPVTSGLGPGELTTPTGAALVAALADRFGPVPDMTLRTVGHGAGDRETKMPNVARVFLGESEAPLVLPEVGHPPALQRVTVLSTNLDQLTAEEAAFAAQQLREAGALDVWMTPIVMKKGRPGLLMDVLVDPLQAAPLAEEMMRATGTLGVRVSGGERYVAPRAIEEVATRFGTVRVKVAVIGQTVRAKAEYEECARAALEHGVTLREVAEEAELAVRERLEEPR